MSRVLVTGGAGFIGSAIVRSVVAEGADVTVIDDLSTGTAESLPDVCTLLTFDVADPSVIDAIASAAPEIVVHAAAQASVTRSVADPARDYDVNVRGTANVIAGTRAGGSGRLVFLSSGGAVYGEADGANEDGAPSPASPYGEHKLMAEKLIETSGLSFANARLANVYGHGQRAGLEGGVVAIFMDAAIAGGSVSIYGDGSQSRDFVFVKDVVRAIEALARTDRCGTWNVGTGVATSVHDLLASVERVVGHRVPHDHKPARAGEIHRSRVSVQRIASEIGWAPSVPLIAGLADIFASHGASAP